MKTTIVLIIASIVCFLALVASYFSTDHQWGFLIVAWCALSVAIVLGAWNVFMGIRSLDNDEHY